MSTLPRLQVQALEIGQLRPAPYNPRRPLRPGSPAYARLERSLAEFDLVQPIVWNRATGHVVAGHQRLEILKRRGATHVDCVVVELPLEREKALNVALNNEQLASTWDHARLIDLLTELKALPDFDIALTGFDDADLRDLLFEPASAAAAPPTPDEAPLVRVAWEIPLELWEATRPDVDHFLATHPQVRAHVRLPN
jgi:ParB-like chromosome segregation protein Spo0J